MTATTWLAILAVPIACYFLYGVACWAARPADE
jgi:hypothetical protein